MSRKRIKKKAPANWLEQPTSPPPLPWPARALPGPTQPRARGAAHLSPSLADRWPRWTHLAAPSPSSARVSRAPPSLPMAPCGERHRPACQHYCCNVCATPPRHRLRTTLNRTRSSSHRVPARTGNRVRPDSTRVALALPL